MVIRFHATDGSVICSGSGDCVAEALRSFVRDNKAKADDPFVRLCAGRAAVAKPQAQFPTRGGYLTVSA